MSAESLREKFLNVPLIRLALERLKRELPSGLQYHTYAHTIDVFQEVLLFASYDNLTLRECELLAVGAAYHDLGFTERRTENEALGADWALQAMLKSGQYTPEECQLVRVAILDTQVRVTPDGPRQVATSKLSQYLLDADVSNLGREDFFERADLVRQEVGAADTVEFLKGLHLFLSAHRWYTPAALVLRSAGKQSNLRALELKLQKG